MESPFVPFFHRQASAAGLHLQYVPDSHLMAWLKDCRNPAIRYMEPTPFCYTEPQTSVAFASAPTPQDF